jgi:CheY-like chemotaxis protein
MKKVLLVSASHAFLRRNTNLLLKRGFQLVTETSGTVSLDKHKECHFDLILADLMLEDMDGCTFCSLVRNEDKLQDVPVILVCHNFPKSIEKVEQSSASGMLIKPIHPFELLETVNKFIDLQLRRSPRVVLKVKVLSKKLGLEFFCLSHDISMSGILLETEYHLEVGSRITCQFTIPDSYRIETEGEIVRSMSISECEKLCGVKFIGLPLSFRRSIENYVTLLAG